MKSFSRPDFVISIEGFSGPLDLLCALVESRKFEASKVKITQLIKIYGAYLAQTRRVSADILAEFFYMAAGLLLEKTRSLLPNLNSLDVDNDNIINGEDDDLGDLSDLDINNIDDDININDNEIMRRIARYRPYRAAFLWLAERLENESKSFRRQFNSENDFLKNENKIKNKENKNEKNKNENENLDLLSSLKLENFEGDIYLLSKIWRDIFNKYNDNKKLEQEMRELESGADWDGFNKNAPDEEQIQSRIYELEERLKNKNDNTLFLNSLCNAGDIKILVVTLLALLEMCRMGKIAIEQDALFGDVKIFLLNKNNI